MMKFLPYIFSAPHKAAAAAAALGLAALAAGAAQAEENSALNADKIMPQTYICREHNVVLPLTYITTAANAYAVMQAEGKQIAMRRLPVPAAASPAGEEAAEQKGKAAPRQQYYYVSLDEQNGYRWYPDGDGGRLAFLAADDSAEEITVYASCRVKKY